MPTRTLAPRSAHRRQRGLQLACAVTTAALSCTIAPAAADACECVIHPALVRPSSQDSVVPTNTKIWLEGSTVDAMECGAEALTDSSNVPIPVDRHELSATNGAYAEAVVLIPQQPLIEGESYALSCELYGQPVEETFTVTAPADDVPPVVLDVSIGDLESAGSEFDSCGDTDFAEVQVQHDGAVIVLDIAGQSQLEPTDPTGSVADVFAGDRLIVGGEVCGRDHNWDFDDDGDATDVRFGVFDLAGNFSGWTPPEDISSCGCRLPGASRGPAGASAFGLVGIMLLLARRRRGCDRSRRARRR